MLLEENLVGWCFQIELCNIRREPVLGPKYVPADWHLCFEPLLEAIYVLQI